LKGLDLKGLDLKNFELKNLELADFISPIARSPDRQALAIGLTCRRQCGRN